MSRVPFGGLRHCALLRSANYRLCGHVIQWRCCFVVLRAMSRRDARVVAPIETCSYPETVNTYHGPLFLKHWIDIHQRLRVDTDNLEVVSGRSSLRGLVKRMLAKGWATDMQKDRLQTNGSWYRAYLWTMINYQSLNGAHSPLNSTFIIIETYVQRCSKHNTLL